MKITQLCLLLLSCALLVAQSHNGQTSATPKLSISNQTEQAISKIIGDALVHGQAYEYDRQIADEIGPRLTGSANYLRAVEWSIAKFKQFGLTNVHTEKFRMDTWEPDGPASGRITSPVEHTLHIYSYGWSPSTPGDGVRAKVVFPRVLTEQALNAQRHEIRGSLVVLDRRAFPSQFSPSKAVAVFNTLDAIAPAGLLIVGGSNGTENMSASTLDGKLSTYLSLKLAQKMDLYSGV